MKAASHCFKSASPTQSFRCSLAALLQSFVEVALLLCLHLQLHSARVPDQHQHALPYNIHNIFQKKQNDSITVLMTQLPLLHNACLHQHHKVLKICIKVHNNSIGSITTMFACISIKKSLASALKYCVRFHSFSCISAGLSQ